MNEHPHTTEGDIECSCNPLRLTVAADGSISRIAGGPLEEPIDTVPARSTPAEALDDPRATKIEADRYRRLDHAQGVGSSAPERCDFHDRDGSRCIHAAMTTHVHEYSGKFP